MKYLFDTNILIYYFNGSLPNVIFENISKIKLPDAIIAATAMLYDLHLITRNVQDFKHINLNLINPFQE